MIKSGLKSYNIIKNFTEIEGKKFPNWHPFEFYAKNRSELKFLLKCIGIEHKDELVAELIEEIDASDIIGELGQMLRKFNPRDN